MVGKIDMTSYLRGIRGATVAESNTRDAILAATDELLRSVLSKNALKTDDIASIFFSVTQDLDAEFPAVAARNLGLANTPLLCLNEIPVKNSLGRCIRILIHANLDIPQNAVKHVYLKEAASLRPDVVR